MEDVEKIHIKIIEHNLIKYHMFEFNTSNINILEYVIIHSNGLNSYPLHGSGDCRW